MAKKHLRLTFGAFLAVFSMGTVLLSSNSVFAEEEKECYTEGKEKYHLQISPVKEKLKLKPGETYTSSITVMNIGAEAFDYKVEATPYHVTDENYSPDYEQQTEFTQISQWITFDQNTVKGKLKPCATVDVDYTIKVPTDVPDGGQYATIAAETSDGNSSDSMVQTINRVAMLLYADVPGNTKKEGKVLENNIDGIRFEPPISVSSLVENTGNVDATAKYSVKVTPFFGGESVFSNEDNPTELDILPQSKRYNTISWDGSPQLGLFWVEQSIEFAGQTNTNKKLVLITPLWFAIIVLAIIVAFIAWIISRIIARNKNKKNSKEQEIIAE